MSKNNYKVSSFISNQVAMMTTGLVAQPLISFCLKMSLEKGVGKGSYEEAFKLIKALENEKILDALKLGYTRRIVSAITPVAFMSSLPKEDFENVSPVSKGVFSAAMSTFLGRNLDLQESLAIVNSGKKPEEIAQRSTKAAKNINISRSLLFARNTIHAMAIFSTDSIAEEILEKHGDYLSEASGIEKSDLQIYLKETLRFAACAATTPAQNLYASFASGAVDSFSKEMFSAKGLSKLFNGATGRAVGLYIATKSLSYGMQCAEKITDISEEEKREREFKISQKDTKKVVEDILKSGENLISDMSDFLDGIREAYAMFKISQYKESHKISKEEMLKYDFFWEEFSQELERMAIDLRGVDTAIPAFDVRALQTKKFTENLRLATYSSEMLPFKAIKNEMKAEVANNAAVPSTSVVKDKSKESDKVKSLLNQIQDVNER